MPSGKDGVYVSWQIKSNNFHEEVLAVLAYALECFS